MVIFKIFKMSEDDFIECFDYFDDFSISDIQKYCKENCPLRQILNKLDDIVYILNNNKKVKYFYVNPDNRLLFFDYDVKILPSGYLSINRDKFTAIQRNKKIDEILGC